MNVVTRTPVWIVATVGILAFTVFLCALAVLNLSHEVGTLKEQLLRQHDKLTVVEHEVERLAGILDRQVDAAELAAAIVKAASERDQER